IDKILSDHAPRRIGNRERKLLAQPVRQSGLGGDKRFEIIIAVLAATRPDAGPVRISTGQVDVAARADRFGVLPRGVVERRAWPVVIGMVGGMVGHSGAFGPGLAIHGARMVWLRG